jgi:hypothetical protein
VHWLIAVLVLLAGCAASPGGAEAGPYRGRVIDADTKEPLAGRGGPRLLEPVRHRPGHAERFLASGEVVTDGRGEFAVGANPPRAAMPGARVSRPHLSILRPGWAPFPIGHTAPPWPPRGEDELLEMM